MRAKVVPAREAKPNGRFTSRPVRAAALRDRHPEWTAPRPDRAIKHFTADDPAARFTTAKAFSAATARCAASFLDQILAEMPFPVTGIQVDGGSEFMAEFERACEDNNLVLFVLPPKRPDLNGAVERAQGSWRYEFYTSSDLPRRLDPRIDSFAHLYKHHRTHDALGGRPPAEYLEALSPGPPQSHMC